MALIPGILPPSRENWELISWAWQFFPLFTAFQWVSDWYPQGKTSITSRLNLPGKWAWFLMEIPGFLTVLYIMYTLPPTLGLSARALPWGNWTMAAMYTTHYIYRAILSPLFLNPSMSPIHPYIYLSATAWQVTNGISIGGWLGGHGPTTAADWAGQLYAAEIGMVVWGWALLGNMFHDDDLREIRRAALRRQQKDAREKGVPVVGVEKVYMLPKNGLFQYVLFPHYLCEWVEWAGFWMVGGWACRPARSFLLNEISTMLPRAVQGKRWYVERFGAEKVGGRWAVLPGVI
ncbi:3-oxo-5-alpha-steroid 4-dehydrogenase [Saccharata proteae CBS 121410]|uniref:3-oxo-5-alpha-steroid 4-dehydrogenase n=1 Tax=Saccharata proteae CBS 121410 TaxID=1314787 RepID=A0A9P4HUD4_9PEZI|nr:3-oxo-5-alpha-steroid 4-dehydrogenase [Saccharata proteae CBS 121410]